jgi:Cytochrome c7 and related cytochrome c
MIKKMLIAAAMLTTLASASATDLQDRMEFPAENGKVVFYHNNHVNEVAGQCTVCHEQAAGGKITNFGGAYAHAFCVSCHSAPADGTPEGPTACQECHQQ